MYSWPYLRMPFAALRPLYPLYEILDPAYFTVFAFAALQMLVFLLHLAPTLYAMTAMPIF